MKKLLKTNSLVGLLLLVAPLGLFAQEPPETPPVAAPIDTATIYLAILGVVFAAYCFYKTNLKSLQK